VAINYFLNDSDCVALYKFEENTLDSKGNNDLTNDGVSVSHTAKELLHSADFEYSQTDWADIANANLDAGFPGKSGEAFVALSIAVWVNFESLGPDGVICGIWHSTNNERNWVLKHDYVSASDSKFQFLKGYNAGANFETHNHDYATVAVSVWYHVEYSYLESSKASRLGVWDDTAGAYRQVLGSNFDTQTFNQTTNVEAAVFRVGAYGQAANYWDGLIDELVICKDVKTDAEFLAIKNGTYAYPCIVTDSGTGSDSITVEIAAGGETVKTVTDSFTSAEVIIQAIGAVIISDSVAVDSESATRSNGSDIVAEDSVTGADVIITSSVACVIDSGAGSEIIAQSISAIIITDSATTNDNERVILNISAIVITDSGEGADQLVIDSSTIWVIPDSGIGTESVIQSASCAVTDSGTDIEIISQSATICAYDTGSVTDQIDKSIVCGIIDSCEGTDEVTQSLVAIVITDSVTDSESVIQSAACIVVDTGEGTDQILVDTAITWVILDSGIGSDTVTQNNSVIVIEDPGTGADLPTPNISLIAIVETGEGTEQLIFGGVGCNVTDMVSGNDQISVYRITNSVIVTDSGSGVDSVIITVPVAIVTIVEQKRKREQAGLTTQNEGLWPRKLRHEYTHESEGDIVIDGSSVCSIIHAQITWEYETKYINFVIQDGVGIPEFFPFTLNIGYNASGRANGSVNGVSVTEFYSPQRKDDDDFITLIMLEAA
jgi:hypothetical protein